MENKTVQNVLHCNQQSLNGWLIESVRFNNINGVKAALDKGADPNASDHKDHEPPLVSACYRGYKPIAELLIERGANIEIMSAKEIHNDLTPSATSRLTPLIAATYENNVDIVEFLLSKGADIEGKDGANNTPIMYATYKRYHLLHLYLKKGASIDSINEDGLNVLAIAQNYGDPSTIAIIEDHLLKLSAVQSQAEDDNKSEKSIKRNRI